MHKTKLENGSEVAIHLIGLAMVVLFAGNIVSFYHIKNQAAELAETKEKLEEAFKAKEALEEALKAKEALEALEEKLEHKKPVNKIGKRKFYPKNASEHFDLLSKEIAAPLNNLLDQSQAIVSSGSNESDGSKKTN
jgi:predicted nuclease with TOPRIM domain